MSTPDSAELALAALARDLVEEIAAGRALELAGYEVKPYQRRSPTGKPEHVREHFVQGLPGHMIGDTSQAAWQAGQAEFEAKGAAAAAAAEGARQLGEIHHPTEEQIPKPKKGAAAVHPQLGGHLLGQRGDTISGHGLGHVPRPFEVPAPTAQDTALGEAHATIAAHRQADLARIAGEQAAAKAQQTGIPAPGTYAPLTDEEFDQHVTNLERSIGQAMAEGKSTDQQFTVDGQWGAWTPERAAKQAEIVRGYLDKQTAVPSQHEALFMGGLPGAGKSTLLKNHKGIDLANYAVINPDDFKEELARRGMVPEVEGLSPMERAALVHEESVHLANLAAAELQRRGKNLAYDVTMKSLRQTANRVKWLHEHGYHVTAVFVDVPVERSAQRVAKRYRKGLEAYRQGKDQLGGRYVPAYAIMNGEHTPGVSRALRTFDALKPEFDRWELYDGAEGMAKLTDKGGAPAQRGISSVEDLIKQRGAAKPYVGNTEQEARAAEKGTSGGG